MVRLAVALAAIVVIIFAGGAVHAQPLPPDYWHQPLAPQGTPPKHWTAAERSLAPEDCGQCHPEKLAEWRTSLHARAFSPGLVGQLLGYDDEDTQACLNCHAPLAEQAQAFQRARTGKKGHDTVAQGLAAAGNSCGGCHLRGNRRFGPPQRDSAATGSSDTESPHGGVTRSPDFEQSQFCAACHQFPQDSAINGKPLENTVAEWQASPAAAENKSCQSCHMPDRQHLWRGIHDPQMVASGLAAQVEATADHARFRVTSVAVGHAFPTYVTPKVMLKAVALDAKGGPVVGSERETVIQRRVDFVDGAWIERFDTRLLPGQSASLDMPWPTSGKVRFWLDVHPDDFYDHDVYDSLLRALPKNSPAARLIAQADRAAVRNRYRLFEQEVHRP